MSDAIGYYAHHRGHGHLARGAQVAAELDLPVTLLSSLRPSPRAWPGPRVHLPPDVADEMITLPSTRALHWAPGGLADLRRRTRDLAAWFVRAAPALVVVDVSVEVALLARLSGVPVVWMRQHGERRDSAHLGAFEAASLIVAPWPAWFGDDPLPADLQRRVVHVGGFSRFEGRSVDRVRARRDLGWSPDQRHVVVVVGGGGHRLDRADLEAAARATPDWHWTVVGGWGTRDGVAFDDLGWVEDPFPHLVAADVVVGSTGHNTLMDVAVAGAPLVAIPQPRPWDEQVDKADRLRRHGLAHVLAEWPQPTSMAGILEAAVTDPRRPAPLVAGGGARRAADEIRIVARRLAAVG